MSSTVIYERSNKGKVLRLEVSDFKGSRYANFREWFYGECDDLVPTKKGIMMPVGHLPEIHKRLGDYLASNPVE